MLMLLLLPLAFFLLRPTTATGSSGSCTPESCGDLTIRYPFSLAGVQPLYCGYPSFELTCDTGTGPAYLSNTFREHLFRVDNISYADNSMVAAVQTAFAGDTGCPVPDFNVTASLALFPFNISATNKRLVFFYNCTVPARFMLRRLCANNTMGAYISGLWGSSEGSTLPQGVPTNCISVSVPVRRGMEPHMHYAQLIRDGFLLELPAPLGDCYRCRQMSGGECRFDQFAFQCVCPDGKLCPITNTTQVTNSTAHPGNKRAGTKILLIGLTSAGAALLFPCIYVLIWYMRGKRNWFLLWKKNSSSTERHYKAMIVSYGPLAPKRYMYSEVMKITSFRNKKLGQGGYGVVFEGKLQDGRLVAVKFLHDCKGNGEEFVNEVMSIGRTSHVNIVRLFGFCLEGSKRALIYEYMCNGSLDRYIYSENPKEILGWERLYAIAIGIARGLEYLHHSCNTRIIHFDIKPQNILLDKYYCPKIADFGLAKLCRTKESKLSMIGPRGTIGFIAPEVHSRNFGLVSTKSDVYSYGMMLLEMVGGRKNVKSVAEQSSEKYFPDWIYDHFARDDGLEACEVTSDIEEIARKMTLIGLWCIQVLPVYRPTITKVLEMFERSLDDMAMPPKQNFSGLLENAAHNMNVQSASSTTSEEIRLVNSGNTQQFPPL
ncbi:hypothetical protein CFC21_039422 [Triticum aestivum]|uniref:Protein kinase domain-containing protein n=4 Tax=Triticum aestivum TaxID=4565 RepID=A0A9R1FFF6_WHEAT|nr:hypothetical protein CFC21_039422 [Triticum aestivum]